MALEFSDERDEGDEVCYGSTWVVVMNEATRQAHATHLAAGKRMESPTGFRVWTDSFSNLIGVLRAKQEHWPCAYSVYWRSCWKFR